MDKRSGLDEFKSEFDGFLSSYLSRKIQSLSFFKDPYIKRILNHAALLLTTGGKRGRPYIAFLSSKSVGLDPSDRRKVIKSLVSLELFHMFALIHDDIMDEGKMRHGIKTIHEHIKETRGEREAYSHAILAGDILHNWAWEPLLEHTPPGTFTSVSELFSSMADQVIVGQMLDISLSRKPEVDLRQIVKKIKLKTAFYTFVNPMKIGIALSKKLDHERSKLCEKIGTALGMAFQIQDDLLDIVGEPDALGKGVFSDLEEGQATHFSYFMENKSSRKEKKRFRSLSGRPLTPLELQEARELYIQAGAVEYGKELIKSYYENARGRILLWEMKGNSKEEWIAFVDYLSLRGV